MKHNFDSQPVADRYPDRMPRRLPATPHPLLADLPARLRLAREEAGYSQEQLAQALGYAGKQVIGHWECGRSIPTLEALVRLADVLRVRAPWLAFGPASMVLYAADWPRVP